MEIRDYSHWEEYKRTKKSIWDTLSIICSLSLTIFNDEDTDKLDEENNQENNDNHYNINEEKNKSRNLPKLTFFDYFFNYIYCEKCCKIRKQKIISKCNEIISKYYSIENIIYNQILLENLFKDYQWNNPDLMTYENNELIIQLKDTVTNCYKA